MFGDAFEVLPLQKFKKQNCDKFTIFRYGDYLK